MNQIKNKLPLASCVLAVLSIPLGMIGATLGPIMGVCAATLAFVVGIAGIVVSRGLPRRRLACAIAGVVLSMPSLLFWGFMQYILWSMARGDYF